MQKETIKIELSYSQLQVLLGCLFEAKYRDLIIPEDAEVFAETQTILEDAENDYFENDANFAINNSI
jgi:hypothetical protein